MTAQRIIVALAVLLAGTSVDAADKLRVVATTADLGALAGAVGGDAVEVTTLARATEDPHFVDAKPSFIRVLNQADGLVEGGAALEAGWLPPLIDGARHTWARMASTERSSVVIMPRIAPSLRILRVSARVSTPEMAVMLVRVK